MTLGVLTSDNLEWSLNTPFMAKLTVFLLICPFLYGGIEQIYWNTENNCIGREVSY